MKKFLALLLAVMMVLSLVACSTPATNDSSSTTDTSSTPDSASDSTPAETTTFENKVILGNSTELAGDFRYPGWGGNPGAADLAVNHLTAGYATMETDNGGTYQWNATAVKSHTETENEDGTITYTVTINEGLKFSDGSPITAKNYVAGTLAFASPVAVAAGLPGTGGQALVGYADYNAYTGPDSATGTKEFAGIRLIDDYTFSLTVSSDYLPYYYSYVYAAADCYPVAMWLGDDVDIMDDGNGCYVSDEFYAMDGDSYVNAKTMTDNRYDVTKFPFSGPYVVSEWDAGTKQATMTINPEFQGNWEGQKPSIETIVYVRVISETQLDQLKTGVIDVLAGITGGSETEEALAIVDGENFSEVHYQRAGYGRISFACDLGPAMFPEVRQAVSYLLNRNEFCQTFTGGYGVVVDGPYSPDMGAWKAVQDEIDLTDYAYSPDTAKKVLEDGGWIYNSKGEPYEEGGEGVDAVRYKKLTADEANSLNGANKTYASVANTDGVEYKTVEINGEYYMPLVINWFGTEDNNVTDMIETMLANNSETAAAGMVIRSTRGDFTALQGNWSRDVSMGYQGTPIYNMINWATGFTSSIYDYSYSWSLDTKYDNLTSNYLRDPYDVAFPYSLQDEKLTFEEAMAASDGKLGMDYLSMAMVYNATTEEEYNKWWQAYIEHWNELMPDVPLYSNYYYDVYNAKIENFQTTPYFSDDRAILYANVKGY